jgi:hypothetical protein
VKVITQMSDLPYSSCFTVEEHMTIHKETDTKCKFTCEAAVVFNKSTMMKNKILERTFADIIEDYSVPLGLVRAGARMLRNCSIR